MNVTAEQIERLETLAQLSADSAGLEDAPMVDKADGEALAALLAAHSALQAELAEERAVVAALRGKLHDEYVNHDAPADYEWTPTTAIDKHERNARAAHRAGIGQAAGEEGTCETTE